MITKAQITLILLCISFPVLVLFFRKSKKKKILIGLTIVIFAYILFNNCWENQKYYFSYEKFYNELRTITSVDVLLEPQTVNPIGKDFVFYHNEVSGGGLLTEMCVSFTMDESDYNAWIDTQTVEITDGSQKDGEVIIPGEHRDFKFYCMDWMSKLAKTDLRSSDYYFLKLNKSSSDSLNGTIVNDKTKEVIQFYFHCW